MCEIMIQIFRKKGRKTRKMLAEIIQRQYVKNDYLQEK